MLLAKMVIKHAFHWMVIAGLLVVARTMTFDRTELSQDQNQTWGTQLGLTEMPTNR